MFDGKTMLNLIIWGKSRKISETNDMHLSKAEISQCIIAGLFSQTPGSNPSCMQLTCPNHFHPSRFASTFNLGHFAPYSSGFAANTILPLPARVVLPHLYRFWSSLILHILANSCMQLCFIYLRFL